MTILLDADFVHFPYRHQLKEFEEHAEDEARALLWQCRVGKTKLIIDTACHLYRRGLIDTVCVFAPNGVHENWVVKELLKHHWRGVPRGELIYQANTVNASVRKRSTALERALEKEWRDQFELLLSADDRLVWFSFNSESVASDEAKKLTSRIYKRRPRILSVWDESTDYRTPGSKRTKNARAIALKSTYRRILDATLSENSPLHVFTQYELLQKEALGFRTFEAYKEHFCTIEVVKVGKRRFPKVTGYQRLDELRLRMAPWSSVVLREDCEDLPSLDPREVHIPMTPEQEDAYKQVLDGKIVKLPGQSDSDIGKSKLIKLQQVVSGYIKDKWGDVRTIGGETPRLDALVQEIRMTTEPVVVWAFMHEEIDQIKERLDAEGIQYCEYHGRATAQDKRIARESFDLEHRHKFIGPARVLIGQPAAGSRGIELSAAGKIIWYSHTFNAIHRQQANERATKMGGANIDLVDFIGGPVDRYIRDTTENKISIADDLTRRGLKAVIEDCKLAA